MDKENAKFYSDFFLLVADQYVYIYFLKTCIQ